MELRFKVGDRVRVVKREIDRLRECLTVLAECGVTVPIGEITFDTTGWGWIEIEKPKE